MKKRIKNFLQNEEKDNDVNMEVQENNEVYLYLLIKDLKKEAELMPRYSVWNQMVNKCLEEQNKES